MGCGPWYSAPSWQRACEVVQGKATDIQAIQNCLAGGQGIEARRDWEALAEDATGVRSLLVRQHDQHIGLSHQVGPTFGR